MASNYIEWYLQLTDFRKQRAMGDATGVYSVLTQNSAVILTCYSDNSGTALMDATTTRTPATMTGGVIRFFTASSVTALDLTILTEDGHAIFVQDVKPSDHRIMVFAEETEQTLVIPYAAATTLSDVAVPTGFSLPINAIVYDCFVHVFAIANSAGMGVGVSGTPSGFLANSALVSVLGFTPLAETLTTAALLRGALLAAAATVGFYRLSYNPPTATAIVYANHATGTTVGTGYIYIKYWRAQTNQSVTTLGIT